MIIIPLVFELFVLRAIRIEDHFECIAVSGEHFFETVEVEVVPDVVDIDFAKEHMVFQVAEPLDPPSFGVI